MPDSNLVTMARFAIFAALVGCGGPGANAPEAGAPVSPGPTATAAASGTVEVPPPPPPPSSAASAPKSRVEIAWELRSVSKDANKPRTAVALAIRGATVGQIDAGQLFGNCSPLDAASWARPEKPLAAIQCGYAGDFRNVGVFRVDNTLAIKVHELEEGDHPQAREKVSAVGVPVAIPVGATVAAAPAK